MGMKIMLAAAIFFGGWLWVYLFVRQLLFNFSVAYPMMKKMQSLKSDLIAEGAMRYTLISVIVCTLVSAVILFVVFYFCPLYLSISFLVGGLICFGMLIPKLRITEKTMFESFCGAYCRFVPDDGLRSAMYSKDVKAINRRLRELELSGSFVPELKNN